jgi:hypothetical protein
VPKAKGQVPSKGQESKDKGTKGQEVILPHLLSFSLLIAYILLGTWNLKLGTSKPSLDNPDSRPLSRDKLAGRSAIFPPRLAVSPGNG